MIVKKHKFKGTYKNPYKVKVLIKVIEAKTLTQAFEIFPKQITDGKTNYFLNGVY